MTIFNRKSDKKGGSADSGYDEDGKSRQSLESRQSLPTGPVISTTRTFQGKFYDPGHNTAHMYGYLISIAFFSNKWGQLATVVYQRLLSDTFWGRGPTSFNITFPCK